MQRFIREKGGTTAIEMAFIMPVLMAITFGVLEMSSLLFFIHRANQAMTETARAALIDPPVDDYASLPITCPDSGLCNGPRMTELLNIGKRYIPNLTSDNLKVDLETSGISSSVDIEGVVTPVVRVELIGVHYDFLFANLIGFPVSVTLPDISASQLGSTEAE